MTDALEAKIMDAVGAVSSLAVERQGAAPRGIVQQDVQNTHQISGQS